MSDELVNMLKASHSRAIEAQRSATGRAVSGYEDLPRAASAVTLLLADGRWYKKAKVKALCKTHKVSYYSVASACCIAESEGGYWCCIPNDNTPEVAPDEE